MNGCTGYIGIVIVTGFMMHLDYHNDRKLTLKFSSIANWNRMYLCCRILNSHVRLQIIDVITAARRARNYIPLVLFCGDFNLPISHLREKCWVETGSYLKRLDYTACDIARYGPQYEVDS